MTALLTELPFASVQLCLLFCFVLFVFHGLQGVYYVSKAFYILLQLPLYKMLTLRKEREHKIHVLVKLSALLPPHYRTKNEQINIQ